MREVKNAKMTKEEIVNAVQSAGVPLDVDPHALTSDQMSSVLDVAKQAGYRKSKTSPSSKGIAFYQYVQRAKERIKNPTENPKLQKSKGHLMFFKAKDGNIYEVYTRAKQLTTVPVTTPVRFGYRSVGVGGGDVTEDTPLMRQLMKDQFTKVKNPSVDIIDEVIYKNYKIKVKKVLGYNMKKPKYEVEVFYPNNSSEMVNFSSTYEKQFNSKSLALSYAKKLINSSIERRSGHWRKSKNAKSNDWWYRINSDGKVIEKSKSYDKLQDKIDKDFDGSMIVSESELHAIEKRSNPTKVIKTFRKTKTRPERMRVISEYGGYGVQTYNEKTSNWITQKHWNDKESAIIDAKNWYNWKRNNPLTEKENSRLSKRLAEHNEQLGKLKTVKYKGHTLIPIGAPNNTTVEMYDSKGNYLGFTAYSTRARAIGYAKETIDNDLKRNPKNTVENGAWFIRNYVEFKGKEYPVYDGVTSFNRKAFLKDIESKYSDGDMIYIDDSLTIGNRKHSKALRYKRTKTGWRKNPETRSNSHQKRGNLNIHTWKGNALKKAGLDHLKAVRLNDGYNGSGDKIWLVTSEAKNPKKLGDKWHEDIFTNSKEAWSWLRYSYGLEIPKYVSERLGYKDNPQENPKTYTVNIAPRNSQSKEQYRTLNVWASNKKEALTQARAQVKAFGQSTRKYVFKVVAENFADNLDKFDNTLAELSDMFQGEVTGEKRKTWASDLQPKRTARIGELAKAIVKKPNGTEYEIIFDGDSLLSMDRRKNLWISGKDSRLLKTKLPKDDQLKFLGYLKQINYVTAKQHIENGETIEFYHNLGEVDGELPLIWLDSDGFLIITGGNYDVWGEGIVN